MKQLEDKNANKDMELVDFVILYSLLMSLHFLVIYALFDTAYLYKSKRNDEQLYPIFAA